MLPVALDVALFLTAVRAHVDAVLTAAAQTADLAQCRNSSIRTGTPSCTVACTVSWWPHTSRVCSDTTKNSSAQAVAPVCVDGPADNVCITSGVIPGLLAQITCSVLPENVCTPESGVQAVQLRSFSQLVTTQLAFAANGAVSLAAVAREVAEVLQTSERAVSVQVSPAVVTGRRRMKSGMSLDVVVAVTNPSQGADVASQLGHPDSLAAALGSKLKAGPVTASLPSYETTITYSIDLVHAADRMVTIAWKQSFLYGAYCTHTYGVSYMEVCVCVRARARARVCVWVYRHPFL